MSLVQEGLAHKAPAGLSLEERATFGSEDAKQKALELLEQRPASGLSAREWDKLGLQSAKEIVDKVKLLVEV